MKDRTTHATVAGARYLALHKQAKAQGRPTAYRSGVRGDGTAEQGFGLGLAIAEAAARRFGGRLELGNGEEGGAVVAIVLPCHVG